MNHTVFLTVMLMGVLAFMLASSAMAQPPQPQTFSLARHSEVEPFNDEVYVEECGACHFPYQAGLLPARSWKKLMDPAALEDHFGDNAELDEEIRAPIQALLLKHSADASRYKRSKKIRVSLKKDEAPLRITDVPYIRRKHHELKDKHVKANPKVESLSYCNKCHLQAKNNSYDDDTVEIPGFGKWTW